MKWSKRPQFDWRELNWAMYFPFLLCHDGKCSSPFQKECSRSERASLTMFKSPGRFSCQNIFSNNFFVHVTKVHISFQFVKWRGKTLLNGFGSKWYAIPTRPKYGINTIALGKQPLPPPLSDYYALRIPLR